MKTTLSPPPQPVKQARLTVVDALRGAALLGILVVHCHRWFTGDALPEWLYRQHAAGALNQLVLSGVILLLVDKFYTLFSLLFGLSFALMLGRARHDPAAFNRRFLRRLGILAAIGFLHYLHWRGDILLVYAVLGGILLLGNRLPNSWLLAVGLVLALNLPRILAYAYHVPTPVAQQQYQADEARQAQTNYHTLVEAPYLDTVLANAQASSRALVSRLNTGRIYQTLGFFLLGLYAGRRRLFHQLPGNRALFWKLFWGALGVALGTKAATMALGRLWPEPTSLLPGAVLSFIAYKLVYTVRAVAITGIYITGLSLFFSSRQGGWAEHLLSPIGRMAVTNYLLQTLIGTLLFFGYGLGLQATTQLWMATLLSVPIFLLQLAFSTYWLAYFRYGPVEWAWRSLTLGQVQPLRLSAGQPVAVG